MLQVLPRLFKLAERQNARKSGSIEALLRRY
jgi:hypothetical protein